ncbi:dihydroneopterin aldolase [Enterococcus sp. 8G7_MSG3316]|uniref:7,8-dihydroneopterin aldolase n=1 Tax=Candidatus Enterococcus testudinis TaxID=1834191 RepID=A0A242A7E2_9ENTE|nr:dihydroneopterin aldolase [Enterococcus sp. 8G7_MSG3316]OTN76651.1 dihydroneopterin aldolase [Enterococcus sp. 8G7_MSG3316]
MYVIKINNMKFRSHIGVFQEEKKLGQNLEIDLAVQINHSIEVDNIDTTINYAHFYQLVSEVVSNSQVDLVETLGTIIVTRIKEIDTRKIAGVKINIRKINVPIEGIFDCVELEMEG